MASTGDFEQWYSSGNLGNSSVTTSEIVSNVAKEAFEAAMKQFPENDQRAENIRRVLKDATSLRDIQEVVAKSMHAYQARAKSQKTIKWLQKTTDNIMNYSNVFKVFVPQHPEYASLAWGAMKFLFTVSNNLALTVYKWETLTR